MGNRIITITLVALAIASVAWGVLAFGAVYAWAYTPLAVACAVIGLGALALERRRRPALPALALALAAIGVAIALQLVPLPPAMLARISPNVDGFLRQYSLAYLMSQGAPLAHALSITPDRTAVGLGLFAAFALFVLGMTRLVSAVGARTVSGPLVALGLLVALVAFVQRAIFNPNTKLMYGFWRPAAVQFEPVGPFVNPNHFAGWMLMALPLTLGMFYGALLRALDETPAVNGNPMALARSRDFAAALTTGFCALVMVSSLIMTHSRSGLSAFAAGSALGVWVVLRRQEKRAQKAVLLVTFLVLMAGAMAWAGFDMSLGKFVEGKGSVGNLSGRVDAWRDTLGIIEGFPVTGTGFNSYSAAMEVYQTRNRALHYREAHNEYLQLAAEGGLLLGAPIAIAIAIFVRDVRRRFREAPREGTTYWLRVGAVVGLSSIALQSAVEFSLQMPGNAALVCVLAAIALHQSPHLRHRSGKAR